MVMNSIGAVSGVGLAGAGRSFSGANQRRTPPALQEFFAQQFQSVPVDRMEQVIFANGQDQDDHNSS